MFGNWFFSPKGSFQLSLWGDSLIHSLFSFFPLPMLVSQQLLQPSPFWPYFISLRPPRFYWEFCSQDHFAVLLCRQSDSSLHIPLPGSSIFLWCCTNSLHRVSKPSVALHPLGSLPLFSTMFLLTTSHPSPPRHGGPSWHLGSPMPASLSLLAQKGSLLSNNLKYLKKLYWRWFW